MPHGVFLGSALATQDRLSVSPPKAQNGEKEFEGDNSAPPQPSHFKPSRVIVALKELIRAPFRRPPPSEYSSANSHADHENNPYAFIKAHIYHGTVDLVMSLMLVAVSINSMSVFYGFRSTNLSLKS